MAALFTVLLGKIEPAPAGDHSVVSDEKIRTRPQKQAAKQSPQIS